MQGEHVEIRMLCELSVSAYGQVGKAHLMDSTGVENVIQMYNSYSGFIVNSIVVVTVRVFYCNASFCSYPVRWMTAFRWFCESISRFFLYLTLYLSTSCCLFFVGKVTCENPIVWWISI